MMCLDACGGKAYRQNYEMATDASYEMSADIRQQHSPSPSISGAARERERNRKIHYDGYIQLFVTNTRSTIEKVVDYIEAQKGYVELITENRLVVQVPAASFKESFDRLLTFGKVLDKRITSTDITEAYQSTELRLKIARATRKKLLALLKEAKDEIDKLELLRQIEEITADIALLESLFKELNKKVSFSKITIEMKSQLTTGGRDGFEPSGFSWIGRLAPSNESAAISGKRVEFNTPTKMLEVKGKYWRAESGERVVFRASQQDNQPQGDTQFWLDAIKLRLKDRYQAADESDVGLFSFLRLQSYDDNPFVYYVGISAEDMKLVLVELYFPSLETEERYRSGIFQSIKERKK